MIADRESFCQQLRQAREASGTTLEAIAEASKIQTSLLAGLERGDLSRWPSGIYRRAFVREYAAAIKVPHPDEVVGDFVRLFPDDVAVPTSNLCFVVRSWSWASSSSRTASACCRMYSRRAVSDSLSTFTGPA